MRFPMHWHATHATLCNVSCAVVGTSGTILDGDAAALIDRADTIFRVNFDPTGKFASSVGTHTDIALVDAILFNVTSSFDTVSSQFEDREAAVVIHSTNSPAEFLSLSARVKKLFKNVDAYAVARSFEKMAATLVSTEKRQLGMSMPCAPAALNAEFCRPSSSFLAALLAIARCTESVTMYGFSGSHSRSISCECAQPPMRRSAHDALQCTTTTRRSWCRHTCRRAFRRRTLNSRRVRASAVAVCARNSSVCVCVCVCW
jgi:hypothetical protein